MAALVVIGVALVATIVAFAWLLDRRDQRERLERADLLQRIQAPQAAVHQHHHRAEAPIEPGSGLPMTDVEIAQMQGGIPDVDAEREKLIAWMESVDNGTAQLQDGVIQ